MSQSFIEGFAKTHRDVLKAFNEGDFETAFVGLAPDVQWHLLPSVLETGLLDGRDAVIRYFSSVIEAGTWDVESLEFIEAGGGSVVVHQRGTGTGRTTGIVVTLDFFQTGTWAATDWSCEYASTSDARMPSKPPGCRSSEDYRVGRDGVRTKTRTLLRAHPSGSRFAWKAGTPDGSYLLSAWMLCPSSARPRA